MPNVLLSNGVALPTVGLGVFRASPRDTLDAVGAALRLGYRHVDTAHVYGNEAEVGRAVRESADGRVRAVGVSNFLVPHLDELAAQARVLPHVNQIEVHPFHQQRDTRDWCRRHGVTVEAYSPLAKATRLSHPTVVETAARLGRSPAQVLLRWGVEQGMVVLPKSVRPARIAENAAIFDFELDTSARAALDGLDEGRATGWDPRTQA